MKSVNISPDEWRWVAIFSSFLVTLTLLPYAWALLVSDDVYQFMGVLPNPKDGATYLAKIQQGIDGNWLFELRHTPQPHDPAGFHLFYLLLGQLARPLGLSTVLTFHLARVATSYFMFFALYQLGASIWHRQRPRRWFFMLISAGSGLGWLGLIFFKGVLAPDLTIAEAFPLLAAYTNAHFPLAIGMLAILAAHAIVVFRPGYKEDPTAENGGLLTVVLSVFLALVSPPAVIVMASTVTVYTLVRGYTTRRLPLHEIRWASLYVLPPAPVAMYYLAVFRFNDVMGQFNEQNVTRSPNIVLFVLGFGLLLLVAIPGLLRALRRFEPDGDQLMLIWFIVNTITVYLPFNLQRRMFIGLIIPIVYFAVRALEDYWFERIREKWRVPSLIALAVFVLPSHALTFAAPLAFAVLDREAGANTGLLLDHDYIDALNWLDDNSNNNDVILAAPGIGLWVPAETHLRPVYGHEFETVPAGERLDQVRAYYRGEDCDALFDDDLPFRVKFVMWGPKELALGNVDSESDNIEEIIGEELTVDTLDEINAQVPPSDTSQPRLPTADLCRIQVEEQAQRQAEFGDVTVYILDGD